MVDLRHIPISLQTKQKKKGGAGESGSFRRPGAVRFQVDSVPRNQDRAGRPGRRLGNRRGWGGLVSSSTRGGIGCDGGEYYPAVQGSGGDFGASEASVSGGFKRRWELGNRSLESCGYVETGESARDPSGLQND